MNDKTFDQKKEHKSAFGTGRVLDGRVKALIRVAWRGRSMHCIGVILGHISTMALKRNPSTILCGQYRCMIGRPQIPQEFRISVE